MHKTVLVILSSCWIAIFGALAVVTLIAAVDGAAAAREAMPVATPLLGIGPLATPAMMGGLSLGSAVVAALFSWMLLTALLVEDTATTTLESPVDLAHGGALGIGIVVFMTTILDTAPILMAGSALLLVAMTASLMLARSAPPAKPTLAPRHVRDRAIEAAHLYSTYAAPMTRSADVVPFPIQGGNAGGGAR
ncbi:MAG: hypothetical protein JJ913_01670 [Rhizobiaceae bacterium]|nr:hypothetical protein [Rhizobiaceae bacterium]